MSDDLQNITQKPRIADKRILPNDYLYLIRAGADNHMRGADFAQSIVDINADYALPVDTNMIGTILRVDASAGPVDLTLAAAASSYLTSRLVVIKSDMTTLPVDCFGLRTLKKQGQAVEVAITPTGPILLVDFVAIVEDPVYDATERLALGTPAGTYVEETLTPNVIFFQTGADASDANSWIALPASKEADGSFIVDMELADASGTVPDLGVLGRVGTKLTIGDGVIQGGKDLNPIVPSHLTLVVETGNAVKAYPLTDIPLNWQQNATHLGFSIGYGVETIGDGAFQNMASASGRLVIPDTVTSIGVDSFRDTPVSGPLKLGSALATIGAGAFEGSSVGGELVLPKSVTSVGSTAFRGTLITAVRGEESGNVFSIPAGVTFGTSVFQSTSLAGEAGFDEGVVGTEFGGSLFSNCSGITGYRLPSTMTTIPSSCFMDCNISEVNTVIPEGVTFIGVEAFLGNANMTGTIVLPSTLEEIREVSFEGTGHDRVELLVVDYNQITSWAPIFDTHTPAFSAIHVPTNAVNYPAALEGIPVVADL